MTDEFKNQVFKTAAQWNSGLMYRLEGMSNGGITLYARPAFSRWEQAVAKIKNPAALSIDECGQLYFIDNQTSRLYRFNTGTRVLEPFSCIGGSGTNPGNFNNPTCILIDPYTLWVLDAGNKRIQGFSQENFQLKYIIGNLEEPVAIGEDTQGFLYVLDRAAKKILKYTKHGEIVDQFGTAEIPEPVGLVIGKDNILYVIDRQPVNFQTYTRQGQYLGARGDFSKEPGTLRPAVMAVDKKGSLYIGEAGTGQVHQFDPDGSFIGTFTIPGIAGEILGIAIAPRGDLYVGTTQGIAVFSQQQTYWKTGGIYYSKTLDSGIKSCRWHRLKPDLDIPPRTMVEVYYYAADDEELKKEIEKCRADNSKSIQQKVEYMDGNNSNSGLIPWQGPATNPGDMLFQEGIGRYLWLKVKLSTYEEAVRPSVTGMRVYYPRQSYLRYLPAIYQEDPATKEFLERFLSLFETRFYDLETEIAHIYKYLEPGTVPAEFLKWLGSWLNLALAEEWEEDKKRDLIAEAAALYKQKGTPAGIARFIDIYTGTVPLIIEHARVLKPIVLNEKNRIGIDTVLMQTPVRGFRLGDDSILGRSALRDTALSAEDPFLATAHRYTVILNLAAREFQKFEKGVKRILDEEKPAHTCYNLRGSNGTGEGMNTYVGINTIVTDNRPMRLGEDAVLGSGLIVYDTGERGGKVQQRSRIARDLKLI